MTQDGLTVEEQVAAKLESLPPEHHAAWMRMGIRLLNGYPMAKAEALYYKETAAIRLTDD